MRSGPSCSDQKVNFWFNQKTWTIAWIIENICPDKGAWEQKRRTEDSTSNLFVKQPPLSLRKSYCIIYAVKISKSWVPIYVRAHWKNAWQSVVLFYQSSHSQSLAFQILTIKKHATIKLWRSLCYVQKKLLVLFQKKHKNKVTSKQASVATPNLGMCPNRVGRYGNSTKSFLHIVSRSNHKCKQKRGSSASSSRSLPPHRKRWAWQCPFLDALQMDSGCIWT
jgi:hypothetical protein